MKTKRNWLFVMAILFVATSSACGAAPTPQAPPALSAAPQTTAAVEPAASTPTAQVETATEEVEPTLAPTPLPTEALLLMQEELIEKFHPAFGSRFSVYVLCGTVLETLDKEISGESASSDRARTFFVVQQILKATSSDLAAWSPSTDLEGDKEDLLSNIQTMEDLIAQWSNEATTSADAKASLDEECANVEAGMKELAETANAEGLSEASLDQMGVEIQSTFKERQKAAEKEQLASSFNTLSEAGRSRNNPYPPGETGSGPNWDLQVLDVIRGEEAWQMVLGQNQFNEPAPEGMEYVLVKVRAVSTAKDDEEHSISSWDFNLTGSMNRNYQAAALVSIEPALNAKLFTNGETEGWLAFLAGADETDLILVQNEMANWDKDRFRYFAVDPDASISIPEELLKIEPTDQGTQRSEPAPYGEMVVTEDWQIRVTEVLRGEEAWKMIQEANQFNDPSPEGQEYMLVKVQVHSISTTDGFQTVDGSSFKTTGSANILYDYPSIVTPEPSLSIGLFPNGEFEGWVALLIGVGETEPLLVFQPWSDFDDANRRYLALEE